MEGGEEDAEEEAFRAREDDEEARKRQRVTETDGKRQRTIEQYFRQNINFH